MSEFSVPFHHESVLLHELVDLVFSDPKGLYVDCTSGGGGHCERILKGLEAEGKLYGLDCDREAITHLSHKFAPELKEGRFQLLHTHFGRFSEALRAKKGQIDGIIADLGVSSPQLDMGERGFSFQREGPLDMRMDQSQGVSAKDLLYSLSEKELRKIFKDYGEEPKAAYIARLIVENRDQIDFSTTKVLADFIKERVHYRTASRKHPATRVFQALRISVNTELDQLEELIKQGFDALKIGGRMAIITFHSLEDRIVKQSFKKLTEPTHSLPKHLPLKASELDQLENIRARLLTKKPILPSEQEIEKNPRARSAKLRGIVKLRS